MLRLGLLVLLGCSQRHVAGVAVDEVSGELTFDELQEQDRRVRWLGETLRSRPPHELVGASVGVSDFMILDVIRLSRRQAFPHLELWARLLGDRGRSAPICRTADDVLFVCTQLAPTGSPSVVLAVCRDARDRTWRLERGVVTMDRANVRTVMLAIAIAEPCGN